MVNGEQPQDVQEVKVKKKVQASKEAYDPHSESMKEE